MAEGKKSNIAPIIGIAVIALILGAYLFVKFGPAQWHWRIYAYQAKSLGMDEGQLKPPASYTGQWNNWTDTGRLLSTYSYVNGKRDGPYMTYNETGGVLSEGRYKNDGLDGLQKISPADGTRTEVIYKEGKRDGIEKTWYSSGQIAVEAPWTNDVQEGSVVFYYENGSIQATIPFYDGQIQGVQKSWYDNGAPQGEETYRDNQKNGGSVFWLPDGSREMALNYHNGKMDGIQTWYFANGQKQREVVLVQGIPNGEWREWNEQGELLVDEIYEMGELRKEREEGPAEPPAKADDATPASAPQA